MSLLDLSLTEARAQLRAKEISATELTQAYLVACELHNPVLNAFITLTPEIALAQAKAADVQIARGEDLPLLGIPIGMKDLFCTKGARTTAGSKMLENFVPTYESTVSRKLWEAGAICLGKTNLDEFAMGSATTSSAYGPAINPYSGANGAELVPGGSSGGSSAAVAAHLCIAATGTDTGGSIRQPAAFTGTVGIKPTYGRASRWGTIAFASSLDQAGTFARNVPDAAIMLQAMCGHDAMDSTSAIKDVPDFSAAVSRGVKGLKIGIPKEYRAEGMDPAIQRLWDQGAQWLREAGAEIVEISLPHTKMALPTYYIIAPAECSSNLARYDGVRYGLRVDSPKGNLDEMYELTRAAGFGAEVKRRILIGTYVLSAGYFDAYYKKAQRVRALIARDFEEVFAHVDAILTPTAPSAAFGVHEKVKDPVTMYLNDVFTVPASLAGLPGMSVPAGLSQQGLPLGLQILGRAFDEETVFAVGGALEQAAQFSAKPQKLAA